MPEGAASHSTGGRVALRAWGRESPMFFGTGGQEGNRAQPLGKMGPARGAEDSQGRGLSCLPF